MRVAQTHVQNHQEIMTELATLRKQAPPTIPINMADIRDPTAFLYNLSETQLAYIRPGLIRVEVLPKEKHKQRIQEELDPIAVSKTTSATLLATPKRDNSSIIIDNLSAEEVLDAWPCCHTKHHAATINNGNPTPNATELMAWEAGILGMSVRPIPSLGWVAMLPGPLKLGPNHVPGFEPIMYKGPKGDDDSQSLELITHARAPKGSSDPRYVAQSAGWIASPREIMEFHNVLCVGGFLPPFDHPNFPMDGLHRHNVEFWSGGIQLWCGTCNIQRILLLDPPHFSKHLIYHTANNKQIKIAQNRLVRVTNLLGQLYTLQQQASNVKMLQTLPEV
jgi:hypothetical protein